MSTITIYHTPRCSNSRSALALIRSQGIEPEVIEYLRSPPDRPTLLALIAATGQPTLALVRTKEALSTELGLDAPGVTDAQLVDAMLLHPILINRPIVVVPIGPRMRRPAERVREIQPRG